MKLYTKAFTPHRNVPLIRARVYIKARSGVSQCPDRKVVGAGFTLIELLVSISIIGILVTIGIASFATVNKQTHDAKRKSDIEQVRSALEMYRSDIKYYPSGGCASSSCTAVDVQTLATDLSDYMAAIPTDPNKVQKYWYRATTLVNGLYYGYCLSANLEGTVPTDTCVPDGEYNWGVSNP